MYLIAASKNAFLGSSAVCLTIQPSIALKITWSTFAGKIIKKGRIYWICASDKQVPCLGAVKIGRPADFGN